MAFEAFLTQTDSQPWTRRRITYVVSLVAHAILLAVGVIYSFWHVEELSPPTVRVTFMTAAPPSPPPPPAAAGGAPKKKVPVKTKETPTLVQPKQNAILQPAQKKEEEKKAEEKKAEDDDDELPVGVVGGKKGGVIGGTIGGTVGGTVGGTIGGTAGGEATSAAPKMLAPNMGALQKMPGAPDPAFPAMLRKPGMVYVIMAKICVNKAGNVDGVTLLKKADPTLDNNVTTTVKGWRYHPLMANNTPVPFCYIGKFEFKSD